MTGQDPTTRWRALLRSLCALGMLGLTSIAQPLTTDASGYRELIGGQYSYMAAKGDSLSRVSALFGIEHWVLADQNGLARDAWLRIGQPLRIWNPHLVPKTRQDGILINVPQRMLFAFRNGVLEHHYPIAVGRPSWPTPSRIFSVCDKRLYPVWYVPRSIQEEMRQRKQRISRQVPPSPRNPLGDYWLGLCPLRIGIHSTNAPASIYRAVSHGCIRLNPAHAAELYANTEIGTTVEIIYQPVLLARTAAGRIYLEVHRDLYEKGEFGLPFVQSAAQAAGLSMEIDWDAVEHELANRNGIAIDVSRSD